jgi:hypothetical protein
LSLAMKTKPKPSYRVRNWSEYDAALKQRGSVTLSHVENDADWAGRAIVCLNAVYGSDRPSNRIAQQISKIEELHKNS